MTERTAAASKALFAFAAPTAQGYEAFIIAVAIIGAALQAQAADLADNRAKDSVARERPQRRAVA